MTLNFDYNEDGLRTKKTVIETDAAGIEHTTSTDYILHGTNIMHLYQHTDGVETADIQAG